MATTHSRSAARAMISPAVLLLLGWMIIPLSMTIYFSLLRYNLLMPGMEEWTGFTNYRYFLTDPAFFTALLNTLLLVGGVLLITIVGGVGLALLLDQPIWGQGIVRILVISPFFVMPTVSALVWKNMFMHPVNGAVCVRGQACRTTALRLSRPRAIVLDCTDGVVAVAALRDADPADGHAIARQRAAGGR